MRRMIKRRMIRQCMIRKPQAGFTLLELVVAIAIFAVIGIAMHTLLSQMLAAKARTDEHSARLVAVQKALRILQLDVEQIVGRSVRDEFGDALPAVQSIGFGGVEFTRTGWTVSPFSKAVRSELQRVRYQLEDNEWVRSHWLHLDRATDATPSSLTLLTDVEQMEVRFWQAVTSTNQSTSGDGGFNQTETWPPLEGSESVDDTDANQVAPERLPALIEVRLELTDIGEITRLLRVVPEFAFASEASQGIASGDSDEEPADSSDADQDDTSGSDGDDAQDSGSDDDNDPEP